MRKLLDESDKDKTTIIELQAEVAQLQAEIGELKMENEQLKAKLKSDDQMLAAMMVDGEGENARGNDGGQGG